MTHYVFNSSHNVSMGTVPIGTCLSAYVEILRTDGVGYVKSYPGHPIFLDGDIRISDNIVKEDFYE